MLQRADTPTTAAVARGAGDPTKVHATRVLSVAREEHIPDDRENIVEGDPSLLVIEDDPH